jgi:hypothetical protein
MRTINITPLYQYKFKYIGLFITVVSFLFFAFLEAGVFILKTPTNYSDLSFILATCGLLIMANSEEKEEDERVSVIRAFSMRSGLFLISAILIALQIVKWRSPSLCFETITIAFLGLFIYNLLFNFCLSNNLFVIYKNESLSQSITGNKVFYISYFITSFLIILYFLLKMIN